MRKRIALIAVTVVLSVLTIMPVAAQQVGPQDIIGETRVHLDGERAHVRTSETNLGNLVADAVRYYAEEVGGSEVDVAFVHAGSIRASVDEGSIRVLDLLQVYTFNNWIVSMELTGEELLSALERGVGSYPDASGGFLQVSGVSFSFDPNRSAGERIVEALVGGTPVDGNETYIVATNNFLARGGDGYDMLGSVPVSRMQNLYAWSFKRVDDALLEYVEAHSPLSLQVEGRIRVEN